MTLRNKFKLPDLFYTEKIHIIGIAGIGMSAIAEFLHDGGAFVSGSDLCETEITRRLQNKGIKCALGHSSCNIKGASLIIYSTAIPPHNVELIEAKQKQIKIINRQDALALMLSDFNVIAISGAHGKTTTTSMLSDIAISGNLNPNILSGGVLNSINSNVLTNDSNLVILESDESDGTFAKIKQQIGIITNIDFEHAEYFKSYEELYQHYVRFFENTSRYSLLCVDDFDYRDFFKRYFTASKRPENLLLCASTKNAVEDLDDDIDIYVKNIKYLENYTLFSIIFTERAKNILNLKGSIIEDVALNQFGIYNVRNAMCSAVGALMIGIPESIVRSTLKTFKGVLRRFTEVAEKRGVLIIDDYAHHPKEIKEVLYIGKQVANKRGGRMIVVMQPHRYTRLAKFMNEFAQSCLLAELTIVAEVYGAFEEPIEGVDSDVLCRKI
ncbi:MAG: UDP-N-acetylmuramate--L-alanine ligase, partial [Proteobacteria bacterium]|nr:UDP-N-acetylmuramate--L-alanine ligase [Pseudomonadota bacterium]